jgi:hypothetical protein
MFLLRMNRAGLDSYDKSKLKTNENGSIDLYFSDKVAKDYEENWLRSAGEDFFVIFRLLYVADCLVNEHIG